ncbi:gamma-glutamylcyclotransferase family protein [Halomonas sp. HNIBRBA4712]|uniref:gamma-glutamylcyclotransferase family protein n=1 Tax=Halomonas sp. HNIBRBA4712 TaxID=3373087 RepID=UPI0037457308
MIWIKRGAIAFLALLLGMALWLWLTMLSPWFYERPAHLAPIEQRPHQVFVYGTLRLAPVRWVVMGSNGEPRADTLAGFHRDGLDLSPAPAQTVPGLLLTVTPHELSKLDRYERLGVRYRREEQVLESGERAWVYRRLAESEGQRTATPGAPALIGYEKTARTTSITRAQPDIDRLAANDADMNRVEPLPLKETL